MGALEHEPVGGAEDTCCEGAIIIIIAPAILALSELRGHMDKAWLKARSVGEAWPTYEKQTSSRGDRVKGRASGRRRREPERLGNAIANPCLSSARAVTRRNNNQGGTGPHAAVRR